jgi:hypothetical protein
MLTESRILATLGEALVAKLLSEKLRLYAAATLVERCA